mmetsp:Transcript_11645/g.17117  ORF Transcript_11645/g.17117 Transcript_11645/m.17117 type:complete len:108 (-) Transcript_11645:743-1066(-)
MTTGPLSADPGPENAPPNIPPRGRLINKALEKIVRAVEIKPFPLEIGTKARAAAAGVLATEEFGFFAVAVDWRCLTRDGGKYAGTSPTPSSTSFGVSECKRSVINGD